MVPEDTELLKVQKISLPPEKEIYSEKHCKTREYSGKVMMILKLS